MAKTHKNFKEMDNLTYYRTFRTMPKLKQATSFETAVNFPNDEEEVLIDVELKPIIKTIKNKIRIIKNKYKNRIEADSIDKSKFIEIEQKFKMYVGLYLKNEDDKSLVNKIGELLEKFNAVMDLILSEMKENEILSDKDWLSQYTNKIEEAKNLGLTETVKILERKIRESQEITTKDLDPEELKKGIEVEMEHTEDIEDPKEAKELATKTVLDHTKEFAIDKEDAKNVEYYDKLEDMEKELKDEKTERELKESEDALEWEEYDTEIKPRGEKTLVFVYGTLKKGKWNHHFIEEVNGKYLMKGVLYNAGIYKYSGYPAVVLNEEGHRVIGEIYAVNKNNIKHLDSLEGYRGIREDNFYDRSQVEIKGEDGNMHTCWIYHMPKKNIDEKKQPLISNGIYEKKKNDRVVKEVSSVELEDMYYKIAEVLASEILFKRKEISKILLDVFSKDLSDTMRSQLRDIFNVDNNDSAYSALSTAIMNAMEDEPDVNSEAVKRVFHNITKTTTTPYGKDFIRKMRAD